MSATKMYRIRFAVDGPAPIPLDMLRYDACFPVSGEDSARATREPGARSEDVRVWLETRQPDRRWRPTVDRWRSFWWRVDPDSIEVLL